MKKHKKIKRQVKKQAIHEPRYYLGRLLPESNVRVEL